MRTHPTLKTLATAAALILLTLPSGTSQSQKPAPACSQCTVWSVPQTPFKIYGNTYYVGTHGLSSILINSGAGLVLIDGALQQTAPQTAASIKTLGFNIKNVKFILNSHAHHDHAGGIAELQRLSGAEVLVSKWSAAVMKKGGVSKDDPQYGDIMGLDPVARVRTLKEGQVLHLGSIALASHSTPGHTPGGTSWTWQSCEDNRCLNLVYADSISAASAAGYKYTQRKDPPNMNDFEQSFAFLDSVPCDILLTPHPEGSDLLGRLERRNQGAPNAMIDAVACKKLEATSREALKKRVAAETGH